MNVPQHILMSWDELAGLCRNLAVDVARSYRPDVVVGIARVGTLPGALMALILRAEFESLQVPSQDGPAYLDAHLPARENIAGRRVLIVDEVSHSGAALRWAERALRQRGAAEVRTLVLFSYFGGMAADFSGPVVSAVVLQPWIRDVAIVDRDLNALADRPSTAGGAYGPAVK